MASDQIQGPLNLLGQAKTLPPAPESVPLPGQLEPQLGVAWGAFHQGFGSSVRALFRGSAAARDLPRGDLFQDCGIDRRAPRGAVMAAAFCHVAFLASPFPGLWLTPRSNPALQNVEITWSGPINDLPLINIPRQKAKSGPRGEINKPLPPQGADAFHPRQRIFTDPARPTHPRQTLINPAAPFEPPKLLPSLPNIIQLQPAAAPAQPRMEISEQMLAQLRPREHRVATA